MPPPILHRFAFTVVTNVLRAGINFITSLLLARWLGPEDFGRMAFLLGTFIAVRGLLDLGTSSAFFTFLSQANRSRRFVFFYYGWLAAQLLLSILAVGMLFPHEWIVAIWKGEERNLVLLACVTVFLQSGFWTSVSQAAESQRQTIWVQSVSLCIAAVHIVAMFALNLLGQLGIFAIFSAVLLEHIVACQMVMRRFSYGQTDVEEDCWSEMAKKYAGYCAPMVPYVVAGFAADFTDKWILQHFGGSVEQAYISVGTQFAAISLIATTSILRIFWKEIAEANHLGQRSRMIELYRKVTRMLYFVGAAISGLLIPWSADILRITLGEVYVAGAVTMAVMFLYPIHQSLGQIVLATLYATEKILIQVVTGSATMLVGIVLTYFVLAPVDAEVPGLGWGSEGLAWKMVVLQFVNVNALLYAISRIWRIPFEFAYQAVVLMVCLATGWLVREVVFGLITGWATTIGMMLVTGLLYCIALGALVVWIPGLTGFKRAELNDCFRKFSFVLWSKDT